MSWNLFIDDERELADVTWAPWQIREKYRNEPWLIARNWQEAENIIACRGMPSFISFDHDLGDCRLTGYDIAKMLIGDALDYPRDRMKQFPKDFDFYVHSQNPVGKANIEGLINGYLKAKARIAKVPANTKRADELYTIALSDEDGDITVGKLK